MGSNNPCVTAPKNPKRDISRFAFDVSGAGTPLPQYQVSCRERPLPFGLG